MYVYCFILVQKLVSILVIAVYFNKYFDIACPAAPQCGEGLIAKEILRGKDCSSYECAPELTCTIEGGDITSFDGSVSNVDLCDHIIAQKQGDWSVRGMYKI
jgi:hypothetical protein